MKGPTVLSKGEDEGGGWREGGDSGVEGRIKH